MPELSTRLDVPGTHNFREVAPGLLRPGRFYRSDALHRLTREGRRTLARLGIVRVIDLRSDLDRRISGPDRLRGTGVEHVRVPIRASGPTLDPSVTLGEVYRYVLTNEGAQLGTAIRAVAEADGPVLVHCTAGKDRTGLVVALVLLALEVGHEDLLADYALTGPNLAGRWSRGMLRKVRWYRVELTDNVIEVLTHAPAPVLRDTLAWLDAEHGGVEPYLRSIGVDDDLVARLRANLVRDDVGA